MDSLASQIIVDIITREMKMPENSVWLRDQNKVIPNDTGLYIVVGITSAFNIANEVYMEDQGVAPAVAMHQINQVVQQENIQIDVLGRGNDAIMRNWEVIAALQSFYSQQLQEKNNFKIFKCPRSYINTSSAEGGSTLNRYSLTIAAMVWYRKDTVLDSPLGDYYEDFTTRVDDAQTLGTNNPIAEFEINSGGIVP